MICDRKIRVRKMEAGIFRAGRVWVWLRRILLLIFLPSASAAADAVQAVTYYFPAWNRPQDSTARIFGEWWNLDGLCLASPAMNSRKNRSGAMRMNRTPQ